MRVCVCPFLSIFLWFGFNFYVFASMLSCNCFFLSVCIFLVCFSFCLYLHCLFFFLSVSPLSVFLSVNLTMSLVIALNASCHQFILPCQPPSNAPPPSIPVPPSGTIFLFYFAMAEGNSVLMCKSKSWTVSHLHNTATTKSVLVYLYLVFGLLQTKCFRSPDSSSFH